MYYNHSILPIFRRRIINNKSVPLRSRNKSLHHYIRNDTLIMMCRFFFMPKNDVIIPLPVLHMITDFSSFLRIIGNTQQNLYKIKPFKIDPFRYFFRYQFFKFTQKVKMLSKFTDKIMVNSYK